MHDTFTRRGFLGMAAGGLAAACLPPTAARAADAPSDFARMLAFVPDQPERWRGRFSYSNLSPLKARYGAADVHNVESLLAPEHKDYREALNGCNLSSFTGVDALQRDYAGFFGYDLFDVDREIWAGQPPGYFSHLEGAFDVDRIMAPLTARGYMPVSYAGAVYQSVRGDFAIAPNDPANVVALGRMNRVAFDAHRLIATGSTAIIEAALDAEAGRIATYADHAPYRVLAAALGDVTSLTIVQPSDAATYLVTSSSATPEAVHTALAMFAQGWGTLQPAALAALAYTDRGPDHRVMHVALVYANPDDAATDSPELVRRLQTYQSLRTHQPIIPTYLADVQGRTVAAEGMGVAIADCTFAMRPNAARFWVSLYDVNDLLFLAPGPLSTP